jgi:3-oxo-5alpha-steroid 4-dehydrogenase
MDADRNTTPWNAEVDILVVGFGAAGACAALEATSLGASVLVVDRFHGGGATAASGGVIYAGGGTPYQKAAGFDDTPEEMARYLNLEVNGAVSDATLRRFCEGSREDLHWLEQMGVPFDGALCPYKTSYPRDGYYLYFSGNEQVGSYQGRSMPAPRGHRARGRGISGLTLFGALERAVRARKVQVRSQTEIERLVLDGGRVVGVEGHSLRPGSLWGAVHARLSRINAKAPTYVPPLSRQITKLLAWITRHHSQVYRARARRGVILAAGGFIFNPAMVGEHAPLFLRCRPLGTVGDDGAGILLGQSVGGATSHMHRMSGWRFYVPPEALTQGVLVNRRGDRICNEELYGATVADHMIAHGGEAWLVFDRDTYRQAVRMLPRQAATWQMVAMVPMLYLGRKKAATLAALATKIGVDAEGLGRTMASYNGEAAASLPDPLGKAREHRAAQNTPPFYAVDCSFSATHGVPCAAMTLGGLVVDEMSGQVMREDGSVIAGLYAAGRNASGLCAEAYVSGLSLADCVFSGRRAGRHAATTHAL